MFPYTTRNGQKRIYLCDGTCFELEISRQPVLRFLKEIGFLKNKHGEKVKRFSEKNFYQENYYATVSKIEPAGKEKVFDITEPETYSMIANGLVVADCGEQPLYSNEACNLGSINLSLIKNSEKKEIDWEKLRRVVHLAVRFLDDVVEVNPYPLPEIDRACKLNRRIGLGVMGWADLLFRLEIPYDSLAAVKLAQKLMKFIQKEAHLTSQKLASERGPFPHFSKSIYKNRPPLRNATLTTIAPTGSISIIGNCSSGIEPLFALSFKHKTNDRELVFVNPYFLAAAKKSRLAKEILREVETRGTLAETKSPEKLKKIFVTAHQIHWQDHINIQAAFQQRTDNAVSKTINLSHEATVEDVERAYLYAYRKGCLGITVYRDGCKEVQVLYAGKEKSLAPIEIKPRPAVVEGKTYRVETPVGTAFVTVNTNGSGEPLEVFVNVGKAGSDISADAEAIGRLCSLNLRLGSGFPPIEVLTQIIDQLEGIGGGESVGFGKEKIRSLADGIAKVLSQYLGGEKATGGQISEQPSLLGHHHRDICPACGRAGLVFEEGCAKCLYCDYNKC